MISKLVEDALGEDDGENEIQLPKVRTQVLERIAEYANHYKEEAMTPIPAQIKSADLNDHVQEWYAEFVNIEQSDLFEMTIAANFMNIEPLIRLTCAKTASLMWGKTAEEIREEFGLENDFTPEEEAELIKENKYVEES